MAYVDLNPVHAGIARSPETSGYTSIRERIQPAFNLQQAIKSQRQAGDLLEFKASLNPLPKFEDGMVNQTQPGIHFAFRDYLELVDWTGRIIRNDKRGFIDDALPPFLRRLHLSAKQWHLNTTRFEAIHSRRFNRITPNIDTG